MPNDPPIPETSDTADTDAERTDSAGTTDPGVPADPQLPEAGDAFGDATPSSQAEIPAAEAQDAIPVESSSTLSAAEVDAAAEAAASLAPVEVRRGGIGRVDAGTVTVSQGGIGLARADQVTISQGGIGAALTSELRVSQGGVGTVLAGDASVDQAVVRTLVARDVVIEGRSLVLFLIARRVQGDVRALFDWRGALAFGAAAGLLSGLLRRRRR